jgi:hypothetical protein
MRKAMEISENAEGNTGEHTKELKTLDEDAITDKKLVNTVEDRMDFLKTVQREEEPAELEDVDEAPIPDVPDDDIEEEDDQAAATAKSSDSTPEEEEKDSDQDATVNIPEAFVRAAIHQGWEEADVKDLIKANPDLALKTLTSCYNSVTNASKEWSALGRARIQSEREAAESDGRRSGVQDSDDSSIEPLLEKLKENYADDPLIDVVSKLLKNSTKVGKTNEPVNNQQQAADLYHTETARATASANASVDQRVNTFFSNDTMSPYEEFYGKLGLSQTVGDLTNGQQLHRAQVMEEAECIMTGKRMRNLNPTIEEVLAEAHLIVTEPIREQVIRNNLKKTAVSRKKTLRPSKSKKSGIVSVRGSNAKPKNRQELLSKVGHNMAKVFNK